MEGPRLTDLPAEVLGIITENLSPGSIRALDESSSELRGISSQPRVLQSSEEKPVEISALRLLPNVHRIQGPVLVPYRDDELAFISRRIKGDYEVIQKRPYFVKDALKILLVRGVLYPQSSTKIRLTSSYGNEFEFMYHDGFLKLSLVDHESYEEVEDLVQNLPITSLLLEDLSSSVDTLNELMSHLTGNSIRELVYGLVRFTGASQEDFPLVDTLRFTEPHGTVAFITLFSGPVPSVTRIIGLRVFSILASIPGGFSLDLDDITEDIQNTYPNLKEGDITFVIRPFGIPPGPVPTGALVLIQTGLRNFRNVFPDVQASVTWI